VSIFSKPETKIITKDLDGNTVIPDRLKEEGCIDGISLEFWDVDPDYKEFDKYHNRYPEMILFDETHSQKIVDFVEKAHADLEPCGFVAHCSAGISRSGAVGTFACDYARLDYDVFMRQNPYIRANQHILNMLRRSAGMVPSFGHDGIDELVEEDGIWVYKNSGKKRDEDI
jgi:hypothetical protein